MSSIDIVRGSRTLIQSNLIPAVPRKWQLQLTFGLQAYALQTFQSAASNARRVVANPNTAARKSERLLANHKLASQLGTVFDQLNIVRPGSYVNVDNSDMHGLTALVGAVQTRSGRAVPCFVEATCALQLPAYDHASPRLKRLRRDMVASRKQQSFTGHTIDTLQVFHDRLGFWPKLVFDRGFGNESIVTHLHAEGATFYVRLKGGRYIGCDGERTEDIMRIFLLSGQGGIRKSNRANALVLFALHNTGNLYEDKWDSNGVMHYTGMGLSGDQSIDYAQNKTLAESVHNGATVHLFESLEPNEYVYRGRVSLSGEPYTERQRDESGHERQVVKFPLRNLEEA